MWKIQQNLCYSLLDGRGNVSNQDCVSYRLFWLNALRVQKYEGVRPCLCERLLVEPLTIFREFFKSYRDSYFIKFL